MLNSKDNMTGAMNPSGSKMEEIIDRIPQRDIKVDFGRFTEKVKTSASKFHFIPSTRSLEMEFKSNFCKNIEHSDSGIIVSTNLLLVSNFVSRNPLLARREMSC